MKSLRSMGFLASISGLICLVVAADKYYSAVKTAEAIAEKMPEFELQQVSIPMISVFGGFVGVMLLVAGVICLAQSLKTDA